MENECAQGVWYPVAASHDVVLSPTALEGVTMWHTVLEKIVEDVSFAAPERLRKTREAEGEDARLKVVIDVKDVDDAIGELLKKTDLSRFVL